MHIYSHLRIGDKIEIELSSIYKSTAPKVIISQVIDLKSGYIYITAPFYKGNQIPLNKGKKIKIIFYHQEKGIFSFIGEVIGRTQGNISSFIIKQIGELQKFQRRIYYRFEVLRKVSIKDLTTDEVESCITKDLSGGGIKFVTKNEYQQGTSVECTLNLNDDSTVVVTGEIVRVIKDPVTNEYEIGIQFKDISESARSRIISFIFERQRLLRKKGLM